MGDQRPRRFDSQRSILNVRPDLQLHQVDTVSIVRFVPTLPGFLAVRRPVTLNQVNALVGRRMFGLAASVVLKRRVV